MHHDWGFICVQELGFADTSGDMAGMQEKSQGLESLLGGPMLFTNSQKSYDTADAFNLRPLPL